jgi:hypothetical protein
MSDLGRLANRESLVAPDYKAQQDVPCSWLRSPRTARMPTTFVMSGGVDYQLVHAALQFEVYESDQALV